MTIPKVIHYCWFGGNPLPELAQRCIDSWRKYLPDYEIKEWNESNFNVNIIPYTAEAYQQGKYAFVSDYARFWILYRYGGIYFDTDVEVIRPLDDVLDRGGFMGFETDYKESLNPHEVATNPGLGLGVAPGLSLIKKMMDYYDGKHFVNEQNMRNQITIVAIATKVLMENGLRLVPGIQEIDGVYIYPSEYFCPINVTTGKLHITDNTRCIHHYAASWVNSRFSLKSKLKKLLPEWLILRISDIRNRVRR